MAFRMKPRVCVVCLMLLVSSAATSRAGEASPNVHQFDFGQAAASPGGTRITPKLIYSRETGFGFDLGSTVTADDSVGCTSDKPFFFSVALPEGNYRVTVTLGNSASESTTWVKAESRRLMLEAVRASAGQAVVRTFCVNVRTPKIASGGEVKLKPGEGSYLHWDEKLTLEFNGNHPTLRALEVAPAPPDTITVYLAGDSTVTDQPREPWNSWGQMLPRFFRPGVSVANHAESGLALSSFLAGRRLEKIMSTIRPGDYLFIQMGHNDQKEKGPNVGAFTTYKAHLEQFVAEARQHGAIPVLVTSMERRRFDASGKPLATLGDFPEAVRRVAKETEVPLIDLNKMSMVFYEAMGPEKSKLAFQDGTHHNAYGSYELAKCVVEGVKQNVPALAKHIVDMPPFDPAHPDPGFQRYSLPPRLDRQLALLAPQFPSGFTAEAWGLGGTLNDSSVLRETDTVESSASAQSALTAPPAKAL